MTTMALSWQDGASQRERVLNAAAAVGVELRARGAGEYQMSLAGGRACNLQLARRGWLCVREEVVNPPAQVDLLSAHGAWAGPAKYTENGRTLIRIDVPFSESVWRGEEEREGSDPLSLWLMVIPDLMRGGGPDDWTPPAAARLAEWIAAGGWEAAIDEAGCVRTVLKRKGCDGQVRLVSDAGRLCFQMRIGSWGALPIRTAAAMRRLAGEANARTRLARVVWNAEGDGVRCDAEVDLTGLPVGEAPGSGEESWPAVVRAALDGLQLILCRLGVELDVLADPSNSDIVEALHDSPSE